MCSFHQFIRMDVQPFPKDEISRYNLDQSSMCFIATFFFLNLCFIATLLHRMLNFLVLVLYYLRP